MNLVSNMTLNLIVTLSNKNVFSISHFEAGDGEGEDGNLFISAPYKFSGL